MVDDSELDYIRTFLGAVHPEATVKHYPMEAGRLSLINDTKRMLVHPPEIMLVHASRVMKRYKVEISEDDEDGLKEAINNVQIGIEKCNYRESIDGFTKPSTWCYCKLVAGNEEAAPEKRSGRYNQNVYIDVEWSTS